MQQYKVTNIKTVIHELQLNHEFKISRDVMNQCQPRVFVKVETNEGGFGLGEAAPLPFFNGEQTSSIKSIIDDQLAPALIGEDLINIRMLEQKISKALPNNHTAKCAIEMALWDLYGKVMNLPVYQLLGGKMRSEVKTAYVISLKEINEMVEDANQAINQGYETLKVKLTGKVEKDNEILRLIRESVPANIKIRADANAAYSLKESLTAVTLFEPYRLEYLEQPCSSRNIEDLKEIKNKTTISIAADESLLSYQDALTLIKNRVVDHFVIKLIKVGGILPSFRIIELAEQESIGCTIVSPLETGIGVAAGTHMAMTIANSSVDHELNVSSYLKKDIAEGIQINGSTIRVTNENGLGIKLKEDIFRSEGLA